MFDCAQSLILNEDVLNNLPEEKRSVFIYEWLCFVNQVLVAAQQVLSILIHLTLRYEKKMLIRMMFEIVKLESSNRFYSRLIMHLVHRSDD